MNWRKKKLQAVILMAICLALAFGTVQVQARDMKSETAGTVRWGYKTNKNLVYWSYWGGVGMIKQNVKVTKWKDRWSGNAGRRRLTFTLTFTRKKKPTAKQLINAATYYTINHPELDTSPGCYFAIVDYETGISLEDPKNPYGVIVTHSNWRLSGKTTYKTKGYSISMQNTSVNVAIEYPASYKNMCIGFGGQNRVITTSNDRLFWDGIFTFWQTDSYRSAQRPKISWFARWWYG